MATAARTMPALEISTADDMDLHSDSGLDYNDGDIELDMEPPVRQDDDVSIKDAASVSGVDVQTALEEQDDFMADNEDIIEEDYDYQDDEDVVVTDQPPMDTAAMPTFATATADANTTATATTPTSRVHTPQVVEEELIDYSDDGDEPYEPHPDWIALKKRNSLKGLEAAEPEWVAMQKRNSIPGHDVPHPSWVASPERNPVQGQDDQEQEPSIQQDDIPADMQALMSANATHYKSQSPHSHSAYADYFKPESPQSHSGDAGDDNDDNAEGQEAEERDRSPSHHEHGSPSYNEEEAHTDDTEGGGQQGHTDIHENSTGDATHQHVEHAGSTDENGHEGPESFELPSVTVNFEGSELWLFKQHDHDDSGDWLIEDISLAKASISDLFQACRSSLGEDVSSESEIGLRFDHLQNMEIYEDNTACVAVSLERLVGLYHTLQAQDGNDEPEPFYISLMFRPRFATLLSDVAKYAEQGSGYAALDAAVAAGETHFATLLSGASSNDPTEWDIQEQYQEEYQEDYQEQDETEGQEQAHVDSVAQQSEHESERDNSEEDYTQRSSDETQHEENAIVEKEETSAEQQVREENGAGHNDDDPKHTANTSDEPTTAVEPVEEPDEQQPQELTETAREPETVRLQKEEDLIDYGDDEEPSKAEEAEQAPILGSSLSSTTVQGDEPANADEHESATGSPQVNDADYPDHEETSFAATEQPDVHSTQDQAGVNDDAEQSYEDYVQAFDDENSFQEFQPDGTEEYTLEAQYNGDANQEYADFEDEGLDQQPHLDFMNGDEFNDAGDAATGDYDYTGTDDFLDLENAPEWAADQEPASNFPEDAVIVHDSSLALDEEDGAAEQTANATSSAANPTTASSSDAKDMSPQGQKRSIDEAGYGADTALDSIDAKRPRV